MSASPTVAPGPGRRDEAWPRTRPAKYLLVPATACGVSSDSLTTAALPAATAVAACEKAIPKGSSRAKRSPRRLPARKATAPACGLGTAAETESLRTQNARRAPGEPSERLDRDEQFGREGLDVGLCRFGDDRRGHVVGGVEQRLDGVAQQPSTFRDAPAAPRGLSGTRLAYDLFQLGRRRPQDRLTGSSVAG